MSVYTHEIFGHVLSVLRVATYEEGLALINRNELANGTAIFTRDGGAAPAVPARRRGQHGGRQRAYYSFGGWKSSLFGTRTCTDLRGQLLHPGQGRHRTLARPCDVECGSRLPADPLSCPTWSSADSCPLLALRCITNCVDELTETL